MADPAPDLATLFAFEDQIETATVEILTAVNVPAFPERGGNLSTPRVEVRLQMGPPTGHRKTFLGTGISPMQTYPDAWHAQLILTTVTNRNTPNNGSRHSELLGKSRVAMLQAQGALNANLDWLFIDLINDAGVIPAVHPSTEIDVSPAVFAIRFSILPGGWPVAGE